MSIQHETILQREELVIQVLPVVPDEVGTVGALLMGPDGGLITGSVTASYFYGELVQQ